METTWRYYDYDYDNNTIIMSDATNVNIGWIMSDEEELKSRFGKVKYPINIQYDGSIIVRTSFSTDSSLSSQSIKDKIMSHSPPKHQVFCQNRKIRHRQHKTSIAHKTFADNTNINPCAINSDVLSFSEHKQHLYNYHYHYFQGLLEFHRITSSNYF
eukprot:UN08894